MIPKREDIIVVIDALQKLTEFYKNQVFFSKNTFKKSLVNGVDYRMGMGCSNMFLKYYPTNSYEKPIYLLNNIKNIYITPDSILYEIKKVSSIDSVETFHETYLDIYKHY